MGEWVCAADRTSSYDEFLYGPEFLCFTRDYLTPHHVRYGLKIVSYDFESERWDFNGTIVYWMVIPSLPGRQFETNADRVRSSSAEELADLILSAEYCEECKHQRNGVCTYLENCTADFISLQEGCREAAIAWLQKEESNDE